MFKFIKKIFSKKKEIPKQIIYVMNDEPKNLADLEKYMNDYRTISPLEGWRIDQFKAEHAQSKCHNRSNYSIKFLNTSGIGTNVRCVCEVCGIECDVTDVSQW